MKRNGFSLLEIIIALAISLLMLTALFSLEVKSSALAARTSISFDSLPLAIERIEELIRQDFTGISRSFKGEYEIRTTAKEARGDVPMTRIHVEVFYNDELSSDLSLYKFKL